jgi:hypothetical protein
MWVGYQRESEGPGDSPGVRSEVTGVRVRKVPVDDYPGRKGYFLFSNNGFIKRGESRPAPDTPGFTKQLGEGRRKVWHDRGKLRLFVIRPRACGREKICQPGLRGCAASPLIGAIKRRRRASRQSPSVPRRGSARTSVRDGASARIHGYPPTPRLAMPGCGRRMRRRSRSEYEVCARF